ncbi:G patch domain-containing protein 1 isoform X1 [Hydra vulgaris]|uniref:G patch domain-containing protein 1 isoform X1 n=1 Tax=Hydra vulgaris TaxID=6087 RepID=UPI001F5E92E7|nr:G patch domain-containing protein 1 [Hydra vulgaris]
MSQSDEEQDYISIGTPFEIEEDEPLPKPVKISDQIVLDKQGRQRFHGAFTGGFSAGYFNTVGSKEGWVPATFKSSRGDRKETQNSFKPEDFMDEDDFADHGIAPKKLVTSEKFRNDEQDIASRKRMIQKAVDTGEIHSAVPGGILMEDLIVPSKVSVGIKLLQGMGWKLGQGIGEKLPLKSTDVVLNENAKKIYGCMPQNSAHDTEQVSVKYIAPKDIQPYQFFSKDNVHGLGYSGINPATAMCGFLQDLDKPTFRPTGKEKRGIRGQAFGVGVFEDEDDDIYSTDKISNYDVIMADEEDKINHGWSGAPKNEVFKGCLTGFIESSTKTVIPKPKKMPEIPPDFQPKHVFLDEGKANLPPEGKLTSKERSILLGEVSKPVSQWTLRWDQQQNLEENKIKKELEDREDKKTKFTSRWDKSIHEERPKVVAESTPDSKSECKSDGLFKPFSKFPEKQLRYEKFLDAQKAGLQPQLVYDAAVTEWERERELAEFARAAILYRPISSSLLKNRFTHATMLSADENDKHKESDNSTVMNDKKAAQSGMFGSLTRTVVEWRPEQLLCKRFNIPDPYPNMKTKGIPDRIKKKNGFFTESSFEEGLLMIKNKVSDKNHLEEEKDENIVEVIKSKSILQKKKLTIGPLSHLNDTNDSGPTIPQTVHSEEKSEVPSIDIFKAIFDNSTSESSSDEEEKENVKDMVVNESKVVENKPEIVEIKQEFFSKEQNLKINQEYKSLTANKSIEAINTIECDKTNNAVYSESSRMPNNNKFSKNRTTNQLDYSLNKKVDKPIFSLAFLNEDQLECTKDSTKDPVKVQFSKYSKEPFINQSEIKINKKLETNEFHRDDKGRFETSPYKKDNKSNTYLVSGRNSSKNQEDSKDEWVENERKKSKSKSKKKKKKKSGKDKKKNVSSESDDDARYIREKKVSDKYKSPVSHKDKKSSSKQDDESVPSSSEIFEKLKSVSNTLKKRASAADFM